MTNQQTSKIHIHNKIRRARTHENKNTNGHNIAHYSFVATGNDIDPKNPNKMCMSNSQNPDLMKEAYIEQTCVTFPIILLWGLLSSPVLFFVATACDPPIPMERDM